MPECSKSIECCPPDPYAYRSADAEDSQAGSNSNCPAVVVDISPVSGSTLFFPSYVVLSVDNEDAVIRYTLDSTDPVAASTLYSAPFQITQAGTLVKARAFIAGCSPGPVSAALYQNPPFPVGIDYSCTTPDKGGTWNAWAPNGNIDSYWQLEFTLTGNQAIKRIEIRQLNSAGAWTTGIIYSTDSPLVIDGEAFAVMPLLLFIAGAQQHTSYQASLGTFGAGTHTWDLYGDKQFSSDGGYWQTDIILGDDTRITAIKTTNCSNSVNAVPCPSPAAPTVTPKCDGAVDVIFANSNPQNYRIYQGVTLAASGTTAANPQTVEITGLTPGVLYYFRVELEYAGCGYQSSIPVTAVPKPDPEVTISTDKTLVDPNESFTISWTSNHIGGAVCGGCLDGEVSLNQSLGCKAGNASGSQATSKVAEGIYTYEITGCNTCGTITASVQVEVRDVAVCTVQPTIINFPNPTTFLCGVEAGCLGTCYSAYLFDVAWNGQIPKTSDCNWSVCASGGCEHSGAWISFCVWCYLSGGAWVLEVGSAGGSVNGCIWRGTKVFGNSPLGVYTRTSGCATGPATITIS